MSELENKSMEALLALAEHDVEAQFQVARNYGSGAWRAAKLHRPR